MTGAAVVAGLRFRRSQLRVLRELVRRGEAGDLSAEHVSLFRKAADATAAGVPLRVIGTSQEEIKRLAAGFTLYGLVEPNVEEVR